MIINKTDYDEREWKEILKYSEIVKAKQTKKEYSDFIKNKKNTKGFFFIETNQDDKKYSDIYKINTNNYLDYLDSIATSSYLTYVCLSDKDKLDEDGQETAQNISQAYKVKGSLSNWYFDSVMKKAGWVRATAKENKLSSGIPGFIKDGGFVDHHNFVESNYKIFKSYIETINKTFPDYDFKIILNDILEDTVEYIKVSRHLEYQKFMNKMDKQFDLLDSIGKDNSFKIKEKKQLKQQVEEYQISIKGIDLKDSENKALHSIQTLMFQKGYYDRCSEINKSMPFDFNIPEFLESFGVIKFKRKNGKMQYSSSETHEALNSLRSMSMKKFFIDYDRIYYVKPTNKNDNGRRTDRVRETTSLIDLIRGWEGLTDSELTSIDEENDRSNKATSKLKVVRIIPHKVFIDQIETNFVMKREDYLKEIKQIIGKTSNYTIRFIDLLIFYVSINTNNYKRRKQYNWIFEQNWKTTAINIRLTESSYWEKRQWSRIKGILKNCYEAAKKLGYVKDYEVFVKGKTRELDKLYLNPNKFYQPDLLG
jgi:hypothetical protein